MRLTKTFGHHQYARGLASWAWIGLDGKRPVLTSLFGDVFLESAGGWWFLDTIEGTLTRSWDGPDALDVDLATGAGGERYLLRSLAEEARRDVVALGRDEVYAFVPPPIVRGGLDAATIQPLDFVVALNIAGQIHHQIRQVPVV